jgi:hypothetical protein
MRGTPQSHEAANGDAITNCDLPDVAIPIYLWCMLELVAWHLVILNSDPARRGTIRPQMNSAHVERSVTKAKDGLEILETARWEPTAILERNSVRAALARYDQRSSMPQPECSWSPTSQSGVGLVRSVQVSSTRVILSLVFFIGTRLSISRCTSGGLYVEHVYDLCLPRTKDDSHRSADSDGNVDHHIGQFQVRLSTNPTLTVQLQSLS